MSDDAAEADAEDGDEAHPDGTEDEGLQYAGMPEGHLEVLGGEDSLTGFEADEIAEQYHREDERRGDRSLGRQHEASGGCGGEGGPDHPRGVLGCHGPHGERGEQRHADEEDAP